MEIAQDADGFHWQLWGGNGQPVARSALPYASRKQVVAAVKGLAGVLAKVKVIAEGAEE